MEREAGILLPISVIPSRFGPGDFGEATIAMANMVAQTGIKVWQILPLNPLGPGCSPYASDCGRAIDPIYICLDEYIQKGIIKDPQIVYADKSFADLEVIKKLKLELLRQVFDKTNAKGKKAFKTWANENLWAKGYGVFHKMKQKYGEMDWWDWKVEDRYLAYHLDKVEVDDDILFVEWCQYIAFNQYAALKAKANELGLKIMGDLPFYVGANSYDAWANQDEFLLDENDRPSGVAGVPPDYFSAEGQRWGNVLYDWAYMKEDGYTFWKDRVLNAYKLFDILRIDHFRAFDTYWNINPDSPTAIDGKWEQAGGDEFFSILFAEHPDLKLIAEDLGEMFPSVYALRDKYNLPGMNVFQFTVFDNTFDKRKNQVIYPGTHDNNTIVGWLDEMSPEQITDLEHILEAGGIKKGKAKLNRRVIEYCFKSECDLCIISLQDILGLGAEYRLNTPGVFGGHNWSYYLNRLIKFADAMPYLKKLVKDSGR